MSEKLGEFERSVFEAVGDDAAWARLQQWYGPKALQGACHQIIGALIDEHRHAIAQLAGEELVRWLYRHRKVRDQVEARLGQAPPRPVAAPLGWTRLLHRLMDAAASGWTLQQTMLQLGVSRRKVREVFDAAGVPLPWRPGSVPVGGVAATAEFARSVAAMRARLAEVGVPEATVAELGTWVSPPPRAR